MSLPPECRPAERYITADELADAMGVSRPTVKRWVRAGVPSETWGMRVRRFRLSEVQAWARERAAGADTTSDTTRPACG